jgi:hypothetical protein
MFRKAFLALGVAGIATALAWAADISGKLIKVDAVKDVITYTGEDGKETTIDIGSGFKVFDATGAESKDGAKDKRLVTGANIKIVTSPGGRVAKELHLLPATTAKSKGDARVPPRATPKGDAKSAPSKSAPKSDAKSSATDEPKFGKDAKGVLAKIVKVDPETRAVTVEIEKKRVDYKVADNAKFVGPRGGMADIKDDRFAAGEFVRIVVAAGGKTISEVHLAYRASDDDK